MTCGKLGATRDTLDGRQYHVACRGNSQVIMDFGGVYHTRIAHDDHAHCGLICVMLIQLGGSLLAPRRQGK